MDELLLKDEVYVAIGRCMEVHRQLGHGFLENVYKDALCVEFMLEEVPFEREVRYEIDYKGHTLKHFYYADFLLFGKIILEIKAAAMLVEEHYAQTINYLRVSDNQVGLLVNFGRKSLEFKRGVYT